MKKWFYIIVLILVASCVSDMKLTLIRQEENIDNYLSKKFPDSTITRYKGSNRVFLEFIPRYEVVRIEKEVDGEIYTKDTIVVKPIVDTLSIEYGDSVHFYYAGYVFTSAPSELFSTNVKAIAKEAGFDTLTVDTLPKKILFTPGTLIPGLENGLYNAKEQEHAIIAFSAEYGFGNQKLYNIPKLSALIYEVWIEKVIKKEKDE